MLILTYHSLSNNPEIIYRLNYEKFLYQIEYLIDQKYNFCGFKDFLDDNKFVLSLSDKQIILTFDDGYKDFYDKVYPLLEKFKLKASLFLSPGDLGKENMLNENDIRKMSADLIEIGSHSYSHIYMPLKPKQFLENEILSSFDFLSKNFKQYFVPVFSVPQGVYARSTIKIIRSCGCKLVLTSDFRVINKDDFWSGVLPRFAIINAYSQEDFKKILEGRFKSGVFYQILRKISMKIKIFLLFILGEKLYRRIYQLFFSSRLG